METNNNYPKPFEDMTAPELLTEVRMWRARAKQNLAETKQAQAEAQLKHHELMTEHRNLMGLKTKYKDACNRITELESELEEARSAFADDRSKIAHLKEALDAEGAAR